MNAIELHEIVKDVPREAWPSCVTGWIRGIYVEVRTSETGDKPHAVSSHMFAEDAVLLFEASMMRWLLTKSLYLVPVYHVKDSIDGKGWQVFGSDLAYESLWTPSRQTISNGSFIEALAAACKAVGQ